MCGIVGYVGSRPAAPIVLNGLRRLEYRGYDSAGIAVLGSPGLNGSGLPEKAGISVRREVGKLVNLTRLLDEAPMTGTVGIGHTRWATHGAPTTHNAHPHGSTDGAFVVVQNGIVENFSELRRQLETKGYHFASETDTEVIVHLIHQHYHNGCAGNLVESICKTLNDLRGPSAIAVLSRDHADQLIVARLGNAGGVVIGYGEEEMIVASDLAAVLESTRQVTFLESRQLAVISAKGAAYYDLDGRPLTKTPVSVDCDVSAVEKGEFRHFMQKEIYEQGRSLTDTLRGRLDFQANRVMLNELGLTKQQLQALEKITIVACGTSYYAGLVGKFLIEQLARVPVEVDYASEFRYRQPILGAQHLVIAITQSGETVDTLAALEEAQAQGAATVAIVNAVGSQAARICDGVIPMQAGPEIGVASTKAFTASLTDLFLFATYLGEARGVIDRRQCAHLIQEVARLPGLAGELLAEAWQGQQYRQVAEWLHGFHNFLYLGRGIHYPIALEGALKLKEISYLHAEGYPAGEMKHGPIALIDARTPAVVIAPRDHVYDKMISQVEQVKARGGLVLAVGHAGDELLAAKADYLLTIPPIHPLLTPVLAVLPLQILAYEVAIRRGADVDQPRNLAKSVTVE